MAKPDATAAYRLVSDMENDVATMIDLARLLTMAVENNEGIEEEMRAALQRLGWVMDDRCRSLEQRRGEAIDMLHGFVFPGGKAVQS